LASALIAKAPGVDPQTAAVVAIATGHWRDAARWTATAARRAGGDERKECLATWFAAKAGDAAARQQLARSHVPRCQVLAALQSPASDPAIQRRALRDAGRAAGRQDLGILPVADDLAWAAAPPRDNPFIDLFGAIEVLATCEPLDRKLWLAPWAVKARSAGAPDLAVALGERAARDVIAGDLAGAHRDLAAARAAVLANPHAPLVPDERSRELASSIDRDALAEVDAVRQGIDLHTAALSITGSAPKRAAELALASALALRGGGKLPANARIIEPECKTSARGALEAAVAGDGSPLAGVLERCRLSWLGNAGLILAVLPRVTRHRAELAEALHWFHRGYDRRPADVLGAVAEHAAHRDLARLAGDEAEAKRWQAVIDRQMKVLDDRDKVVALELWAAF
jgi:hypothetical protein